MIKKIIVCGWLVLLATGLEGKFRDRDRGDKPRKIESVRKLPRPRPTPTPFSSKTPTPSPSPTGSLENIL